MNRRYLDGVLTKNEGLRSSVAELQTRLENADRVVQELQSAKEGFGRQGLDMLTLALHILPCLSPHPAAEFCGAVCRAAFEGLREPLHPYQIAVAETQTWCRCMSWSLACMSCILTQAAQGHTCPPGWRLTKRAKLLTWQAS